MSRFAKSFLVLSLLSVLPAASQATIVLVERSSALHVFYQYGGGGDQFPGSNSTGSIELNSDFNLSLNGNDSGSGSNEFGLWESGISYNLTQQWANLGNGFSGSAATMLTSFEGGIGNAMVESNAPGNELILMFSNTSTTDFTFSGHLGRESVATIEKLFEHGWEPVFTAANVGGFTQSSFNTVGNINAGTYRILARAFQTSAGNQFSSTSFDFNFAAVPEPGTMIALGVGAAALLRRRRR